MNPHDGSNLSDLAQAAAPAARDTLGDLGLLGAIAAVGELEAEFPRLLAAALARLEADSLDEAEVDAHISLFRGRAANRVLAAIA